MRLLATVTGGLFDSFEKWKAIPNERGDLTKASIFESALRSFYIRILKRKTWNPLKDQLAEG